MLREAEKCAVKMAQWKCFNKELKLLKMKEEEKIKISCKISSLTPYLNENWIISIGGILEKSSNKHPILILKDSPMLKLIILWCHQKTGHSGGGMTLNEARNSGFWIVNTKSVKRSMIYYCVTCTSLRGGTWKTIDVWIIIWHTSRTPFIYIL